MHTMVSAQTAMERDEVYRAMQEQAQRMMRELATLILSSPDQELVVDTSKIKAWPITPWVIARRVDEAGKVVLTVETVKENLDTDPPTG